MLQSLLITICCVSTIALLVIAGLAAFFIQDTRKKQKHQKFQASTTGLADVSLSDIDRVLESGAVNEIPFTDVLIGTAQQIKQLAEGDTTPLETDSLRKLIQDIESFRRRAQAVDLPGPDLNESRRDDLNRLRDLVATSRNLVKTAESGDPQLMRDALQNVDSVLGAAVDGHIDFRQQLLIEGIEFPLSAIQPKASVPHPQDIGLATKWQYIQMCKAVMCTTLCNEILHGNREIEGLAQDADQCAEWSAQWLKPHWEFVIKRFTTTFLLPDAIFELYPVLENTQNRGQLYYSGKFSKFVDASSPVLRDAERLDETGTLGLLCDYAISEYGSSLTTIFPNDPDLEMKIESNDQLLGAKFDEYTMMSMEQKIASVVDRDLKSQISEVQKAWDEYLAPDL